MLLAHNNFIEHHASHIALVVIALVGVAIWWFFDKRQNY